VERSSGAAPPRQPGGSDGPDATGTTNGQLLRVRVEPEDPGISVLSLAGELDLSTIPRVEGPLFTQVETHSAVVLDLTALSFIDSSGIGLLIKAFRAGEDGDGAKLHTVVARNSQVERVFKLACIDRALPLYLDREAAVAALAPAHESPSGDQAG
jgi:anti-sigma B factor antagonist